MNALILEEHSSVLPEWWSRKAPPCTLIYLDAHLDLQHISGNRIDALRQCSTKEAVKRLEKSHHLLADRESSYSLEDFLYPAHCLGLIDRLIWIAPPHVETAYSRAIISRLQQMDGVLMDDLTSFHVTDGGWIEGRLLGLNITICNFKQLKAMTLPVDSLIDIDTDYFVTVPGDELWVNPRTVFEALDQLPLTPELITVSRSVSSGFTPLRYRFLADYLESLWNNRPGDAAHFEQIFLLDRQLTAGDFQSVISGCQKELKKHPDCAATHYLLALAARDPELAMEHGRLAGTLCASYQPSTLRAACEIPNRNLPISAETMIALERQLADTQHDTDELALAHLALGLIYCTCGDVSRAFAHYQHGAQRLGHHPELALEIGKLLLRTEQVERALPFLDAALLDDKTRAAAHVFLAHFHAHQKSLVLAAEHLEAALAMAPSWLQVLAMLVDLYQQLGDGEKAQTLLARLRDQQSQTARLANQLAAHGARHE